MAQLLYRYLTLTYGLEVLQTGRWKIGRLTELNDPLDCFPLIQSAGMDESALAQISDGMVESMSRDARLLCFSKTITDPVLWSHYAESHVGLVLGFDFSQEENLLEVKYNKERPRITVEDLIAVRHRPGLAATPQGQMLIGVFTTKAPSWSYEQEFRALIDLKECILVGRHYFRNLPQRLLREVILGARCPMSMADIHRTISQSVSTSDATKLGYPPDVKIRQCRRNPSSFTLELEDFVDSPASERKA